MKRTALTVAFLVFLSAFVVIIILPEVRATTLYVGGGGPGNYTTIQGAIDAAVPGNTIFAYNGTYNERLVIDKTLSLIGESRDSTWINGGGVGDTVYVSANWVNLTGFLVLNGGLIPWDAGIELDHVQNCDISGNNFFVNDYDGIFLRSSSNNTIANNSVNYNSNLGIYLLSSHNNTIIDNNVSSNWFGITLDTSNGNVIGNNDASNADGGISLHYSNDNTIIGNIAANNTGHGIYLEHSDNTRIEENIVSNNTSSSDSNDGIHIEFSNDNFIVGNNVSRNEAGIYLYYADRHTVVSNVASNNVYDIYLRLSRYGWFTNNVMAEDGFYLEGSTDEWNTHHIDTSNIVNGRPVRYWKNATGGTVALGAGQVILANCTGVTVEGQTLSKGHVGIAIGHSSGNTVINNNLSSNGYGILLHSSDGNTVKQNTIHRTSIGVSVSFSDGNNITDNDISLGWMGILLPFGDKNTVGNNTLSGNWIGLELRWSNRNVITNNSLHSNTDHGVAVLGFRNSIVRNLIFNCRVGVSISPSFSHNNTVYHNDFILNSVSASDGSIENRWDDGYPSGGNYWSDYSGIDLLSGPNQTQPGSDGIGDTPYDKIGVNEDRYPLMLPMTTILPREPRILRANLSGDDMENVTLAWNTSPDDGSGLRSVVGYEVYRGSTYDQDGQGYGLVASLSNGTSSYVDNHSGEGDPEDHFYRVCAVDMNNMSVCDDTQAAKFTRPLALGPNLVSIPLIQSNESIDTVLQTVKYDKTWFYDSSSQEWKWYMTHKEYRRGLWNTNHTTGIWVNLTEASNLTVAGVVPAQTTIHLYKGWNLVSFPSVNPLYTVADLKTEIGATRVEGHDLFSQHHLRVLGDGEALQAGYGYWVRVGTDTDWRIDVS